MQLGRLSLIVEAADVTQHLELLEISSHLNMIKDRFEKENKNRFRPGVPSAEQRLQAFADLRQEINDFVNNAQLRMLMQIRESSSKTALIDKVPVIAEYQVTDQVLMYEGPYETVDMDYLRRRYKQIGNGEQGRPAVRVNTRRGRYGNLPVIYKTYSSHSNDGAAAKIAEDQLKCISRVLHPNIANLVGITQGYYGINGVVVTARGLPYSDFLLQVSSGATLVKCMRGILAAHKFISSNRFIMSSSSFNIAVESNGQATLVPTLEGEIDAGESVQFSDLKTFNHLSRLKPRGWQGANPATRHTMLICSQNAFDYCGDTRTHRFLDRISALDWIGFTELEVTRLAAECNMLPAGRFYFWRGETPPPFTVDLGGIGRVVEREKHQSEWHSLHEGTPPNPDRTPQYMMCGTWDPAHYNSPTANDGWNSSPVCGCKGGIIDRPGGVSPSSWDEFTNQARRISSQTGINLDEILYCTLLFRTVHLYPPQSEETESSEEVYFHSNPSSRSNLREYWGFLSTSPDPCASDLGSNPLAWKVVYEVELLCFCTTDGWDYRYQEMLQSALASIPGSFPGSQIEEVPDDKP
ncbi:hypothetical protein FS749_012487 [Ceratobasidium sp. UAMH 11750]|nr:hypothetical protein FS749_012487 [Ceratobasidium sp. UAMH 11750]